MARIFYRYLRPQRFNTDRLVFDTQSTGGICLRFEEDLDGTLWFTHSRCHPEDHFNKKVAKQIADSRAEEVRSNMHLKAACGGIPFTEDTEILACSVASHCELWAPPGDTDVLIQFYLNLEWKGLAAAINQIIDFNRRQRSISTTWFTAAHAIDAYGMYKQKANLDKVPPDYDPLDHRNCMSS